MTEIISFILQILGMGFLIYGYRKSNRNLMLVGALVLWFGGSLNDAVHGFIAGFNSGSAK